MGTLVPRNTGVPPMISVDILIIDEFSDMILASN
jgi:hypothetical protein